jgi:hypothetical protein
LCLKRYHNPDIVSGLEDVYGALATTLRTAERWTKEFVEERITLSDSLNPGRPPPNDLIDAVKQIIGEDLFCSQKRMAQRPIVYDDSIKRILTPRLGSGT